MSSTVLKFRQLFLNGQLPEVYSCKDGPCLRMAVLEKKLTNEGSLSHKWHPRPPPPFANIRESDHQTSFPDVEKVYIWEEAMTCDSLTS